MSFARFYDAFATLNLRLTELEIACEGTGPAAGFWDRTRADLSRILDMLATDDQAEEARLAACQAAAAMRTFIDGPRFARVSAALVEIDADEDSRPATAEELAEIEAVTLAMERAAGGAAAVAQNVRDNDPTAAVMDEIRRTAREASQALAVGGGIGLAVLAAALLLT